MRLGTTHLSEHLKITNCSEVQGPPSSALCQQCIQAGCGWSNSRCSWADQGLQNELSVCQKMESGTNLSRPEISSITPSVVSFYGRNHALLSGRNLRHVTRVRIQASMDCSPRESPVWSNTGVNLTFHIPRTDFKGMVKVCLLLPDGSCHGNAKITYRSSPSCTGISPNSTWMSGKRRITLTGTHLEFVEGVQHSDGRVRPPTDRSFQTLTYETPAELHGWNHNSPVSLKVADETLRCSGIVTYYPDPEFIDFTVLRVGDDVLVTLQKKADKLEMTPAELSVWGVQGQELHPCIMKAKETRNKTELFTCEIRNSPVEFWNLKIVYGDRTVGLEQPSLLRQVLLILLIPFIIAVLVMFGGMRVRR